MILSISPIQVILLCFLLDASTTAGRESYEPPHLRRQERDAVRAPPTRTGTTRSLSPFNCTSTDAPVTIAQENIYDAVREWLDNRDVACSIYGPIDAWNTTSVTNMTKLFQGVKDFQGNIAKWDVSNVVAMEHMFTGWNSPFDMDLSAWNVSHVENFYQMFWSTSFADTIQCWCWEISPTANANISNVLAELAEYDYYRIVANSECPNWVPIRFDNESIRHAVLDWEQDNGSILSYYKWGNISEWNTTGVTNMAGLFDGFGFRSDFDLVDLSQWDTGNVVSMAETFRRSRGNPKGVAAWDVGSVINFHGMFQESEIDADMSGWNTASAEDVSAMFAYAETFNSDLSKWSTGNVKQFAGMFEYALSFNANLTAWDMSSAESIFHMFRGASSFEGLLCWALRPGVSMDVPVSANFQNSKARLFDSTCLGWPLPIVDENIYQAVYIWSENAAESYNLYGDIADWNTSDVTSMHRLFVHPQFGSMHVDADVSRWNVAKVEDFSEMFLHASDFNNDLSSWKLASAKNISRMFFGACDFHRFLCRWRDNLAEGIDIHDAFGQKENDYCSRIDRERQVNSMYCIDCSICEEGVKNPDAIAFDHLHRKTIENIFGCSQSVQEYLSITCEELDRYPLSVFLDSVLGQKLQNFGLVESLELDAQFDDYMCQVSAAVVAPLVSESCCVIVKDPEEVCGMCKDGKTIRDPGLVVGDNGYTCEFLDWTVAAAHGSWQADLGETDCEYFKLTALSSTRELSFVEALRILGRECGCSNQVSPASGLVASLTAPIMILFVATILLGA
jgi:hypothetical protein